MIDREGFVGSGFRLAIGLSVFLVDPGGCLTQSVLLLRQMVENTRLARRTTTRQEFLGTDNDKLEIEYIC